jgi:hypothetical protein
MKAMNGKKKYNYSMHRSSAVILNYKGTNGEHWVFEN